MKLLDIGKCHVDSPDFKADLATLEDATTELEKKIKRICEICKERQEVAERERALTQRLIQEFDFFASHDLDCAEDTENATNSVEMMTTALRQLVDHHERMSEQINIAILNPLQKFMTQDLEHVKAVKKTYHKVRSEATHALEKFSQCKRPEMSLFNELSLQLFDARHELHKTTCNYALELNSLHSKTTPDFLNRIVDFVMSQLSYFHLGHLTIKDSEPHITALYTLVEKLRSQNIKVGTQDSSRAKNLLDEVWVTRAQNLVRFYQDDLSYDPETAKSTISRHLSKYKSDIPFEDRQLEPPTAKPSLARTKNGYLWYAEHRTFGTTWMRLYFCITKGILVSPDSTTKAKLPISLGLNLCNVKPALPTDTERNFAFKITSPSRVLLLQAEDSRDLQDWMEVLNNAITFAIQGQSTSPDREMTPSMLASGGDKSMLESSLSGASDVSSPSGSDGAPVRPPRRRSAHISKELYALPGNTACADCGNNKPKWASVNLGVLICIECSGVHRSLGVYISQVRSLTLDTLKSEWVVRMKEVGNTKSNAVYEELLPKDFDRETLRKKEDWRQEFITDKYVAMKYTSQENKERILQERQAARSESLLRSGVTTNSSPESLTPSSSASQLPTVAENNTTATPTPNSTSPSLQDGATSTLAPKSDCVSKPQDSLADPASTSSTSSSSHGDLAMTSSTTGVEGQAAADGGTGSVFKKMTKSLGTAKDALVKFAKNE